MEHASQRVQFGRKIDTFGAIQEKIARMGIAHYVTQVCQVYGIEENKLLFNHPLNVLPGTSYITVILPNFEMFLCMYMYTYLGFVFSLWPT